MNMEETNTRLARQAEIIARQESYIAQLREDLEGAYAALRARENADAAEMKAKNVELPICKHGVASNWHRQPVGVPSDNGLFINHVPGPVEFLPPECPTPDQCFAEMQPQLAKVRMGVSD